MTTTTDDRGRNNMFAREPQITYSDHSWGAPHNEIAEKLNARLAMLGIVAGFIFYALTGKLFFGVW